MFYLLAMVCVKTDGVVLFVCATLHGCVLTASRRSDWEMGRGQKVAEKGGDTQVTVL